MKKSTFLSLLLMIASIFLFTSCGQNPSYSGKFSQDEFVYSLGQKIDFLSQLTLNGIEKEDVGISVSNEIATKSDDGFVMTNSGRGLVTASKQDKIFASASVVVKGKFSAPQNLQLGDDGRVTWDSVFTYFDNQIVSAQSYTIYINEQLQSDNLTTNNFQLTQNGHYKFKVKANATGYVDDDNENGYSEIEFDYYAMPKAINVDLSSQSQAISQNSIMNLTWNMPIDAPNAKFDVIFDGIKIATNILGKQAELDFSHFDGGKEIKVEIIAKHESDENFIPSSYALTITKLSDISLEVNEGKLRWSGNADNYIVYSGAQVGGQISKDGGYNVCSLENLPSRSQQVSVQAKGGKLDDTHFYADSAPANITINKLATPNVRAEFDANNLILNIEEDEYEPRYLLSINGAQNIEQVNGENKIICPLEDLQNGKLEVALTAIYKGGDEASTINSNEHVETLYKLANITDVKHQLNGQDSVLTFDAPYFEEDVFVNYSVSLNGQELSGEQAIVSAQGKQVTITIKNLAQYEPGGNDYSFTIKAVIEEKSNTVSTTKTISILPKVVKAQQQENGYFAWDSLGENVSYVYTIYSSDKEQILGEIYNNQKDISTTDTKTKDALPFGYYKIRVVAKAETDEQGYQDFLDADFGDKIQSNYFEQWFYATQQIQSPTIEFDFKDGQYVLTITRDELAGLCEVYLDDQLIDRQTEFNKQSYEVKLTENFSQAKTYVIKVLHKSNVDDVLNPDAEPSILNVTRLKTPSDEDLTLQNENLLITLPTGTKSVDATKDGSEISVDANIISLQDYENTFVITLKFVSQERKGNNVYLSSVESGEFNFTRLAQPTQLTYSDGTLSYTSAIDADEYYIKLNLIPADDSGLSAKSFEITSTGKSYNLNAYIQSRLKEDEENIEFISAYNQAEKITVQVLAYKHGKDGQTYYLPSRYSDEKQLEKLDDVKIEFDAQKQILRWNDVGDANATTYSIFVADENGEFEEFKQVKSGNQFDFSSEEIDFLMQKRFYVLAKNSAYLTSSKSNIIAIRKLASVGSLNVGDDQASAYTHIASQDINKTDGQVYVNAQLTNLNGDLLSLPLGQDEIYSYSIQLVTDKTEIINGVTYYYISSDITQFTFKKLSAVTFNTIKEISFYEPCADMTTKNVPIIYTMTVQSEGVTIANGIKVLDEQFIKDHKVTIPYDHEILMSLNPGQYSLIFDAYMSAYEIQQSEIGYFGSLNIGKIESIKKYDSLPTYNLSVIYGQDGNKIDNCLASGFKVSWEDIWHDENIAFAFNLNTINDEVNQNLRNFKAGQTIDYQGGKISLSLEENTYILTVDASVANVLFATSIAIPTSIHADDQISSNSSNLTINRLANVANEGANLTYEGQLTFQSVPGATKYYYMLSFGGEKLEVNEIDASSQDTISINIFDYFDTYAGNYTLSILADDLSGNNLPSNASLNILGYRLRGLSNIDVQSSGEVVLQNAPDDHSTDGIIFNVKFNNNTKSFVPNVKESNISWSYSIADFVDLIGEDALRRGVSQDETITLEIFTHLDNSDGTNSYINSIGKTFTFKFKQDYNASLESRRQKSYINDKLAVDNATDLLVLIEEDLQYANLVLSLDGENMFDLNFKGFWIVTQEGEEYFAQDRPAHESGLKITPCLAIDVVKLLEGSDAGEHEFKVSRTDYIEGEFIYYATSSIIYTKLTQVEGQISFANDTFVWTPVQQEGVSGYYVNVYDQDDKLKIKRDVAMTPSINITELISQLNENLYVTITTYSTEYLKDTKLTLSSPTEKVSVIKYKAPSVLKANNGVLEYDISEEEFELFTDISTYDNSSLLMAETIMQKQNGYGDPFMFTASDMASKRVRIKFETLKSSAVQTQYYLTMPAINLLPQSFKKAYFRTGVTDKTYLQRLKECADAVNSTPYASFIRNLANALNDSQFGLGSMTQLFDDYGNEIPAGEYNISIRLEGEKLSNTQFTLSSPYSDVVTMAINVEPTIQVHSPQDSSASGRNVYYLSFKQVETIVQEGQSRAAEKYLLNFRVLKDGTIVSGQAWNFEIEKTGEAWQLYYDGEDKSKYFTLSTDIYDNSGTYITINLTEFANEMQKGNIHLLGDDNAAQYSVAVYTLGNNYSLNSKTDSATVEFLKFDYLSMKLSNGILSWNSTGATRVVYKHEGFTAQTRTFTGRNQTLQFRDGNSESDKVEVGGLYEYIDFMARGEINNSTKSISVDSPIYRLENVYKRYQPNVEIEGGAFKLSNDRREQAEYANELKFNIFNDQDKDAFVYPQSFTQGESVIYTPGNKPSEQNASLFTFSSAGNSITSAQHFTIQNIDSDEYDNLLKINQDGIENCILQSEYENVQARMLSGVAGAKILGDKVDDNGENLGGNFDFDGLAPELKDDYYVAYRILVYHYSNNAQIDQPEIFYTLNTTFASENIKNLDMSYTYSISVTPIAASIVDDRAIGAVQTIEGQYLLLGNGIKYQDESFALIGPEVFFGNQKIQRLSKPLQVDAVGDGLQINFPASLQSEDISFKVFDQTGREIKAKSIEKSDQTYNNGQYKQALFHIDENQLVEGPSYTLSVCIYLLEEQTNFNSTTYLTSQLVNLAKNVYKLKKLSRQDMSLGFNPTSSTYTLDVSKYYRNFSTFANHMKITATFVLGESELGSIDLTATRATQEFKVGGYQNSEDGLVLPIGTNIKFKAVSTNTYTDGVIFDSDTCDEITLSSISFGEGDKITWNDQDLKFAWTFDGQELNNKQFIVYLQVNANGIAGNEISDIMTVTSADELYYLPRSLSTILHVYVYVREGELTLFSQPLVYDQNVDFNLFQNGTGENAEKAFVIANEKQLRNIERRNNTNTYFRLDSDLTLTLDGPLFKDNFAGILDCDNHAITLNINSVQSLASSLDVTLPTGSVDTRSVNFQSGIALFNGIATRGEIKNLKLNLNIDFSNLSDSGDAVVAPIAITNNGLIQNITIQNVSARFNTSISKTIALNGVAATNNGTGNNKGRIVDCTCSADTNISLTSGSAKLDLVFCGIALSCRGGQINHCFMTGGINVNTRLSGSRVWVAGIVGSASSNATIKNCGNDGNITVQSGSVNLTTSVASGIALKAENSTISLCYNNGQITLPKQDSVGGIVGLCTSSTLTGLVDTTGTNITLGGAGNDQTSCYVLPRDSANVPSQLDGDGCRLTIERIESGYKAKIEAF